MPCPSHLEPSLCPRPPCKNRDSLFPTFSSHPIPLRISGFPFSTFSSHVDLHKGGVVNVYYVSVTSMQMPHLEPGRGQCSLPASSSMCIRIPAAGRTDRIWTVRIPISHTLHQHNSGFANMHLKDGREHTRRKPRPRSYVCQLQAPERGPDLLHACYRNKATSRYSQKATPRRPTP